MKRISLFVFLAALAAGEGVANELFLLNSPVGTLDGAAAPLKNQSETQNVDADLLLKEASELRAECYGIIADIYHNLDSYSAEKLQELKDAVEAKINIALETALEYHKTARMRSGPPGSALADGNAAPDQSKEVGLDQGILPDETQRGIASISGEIPELRPQGINWQDVKLTADSAEFPIASEAGPSSEVNDSLWAAVAAAKTRENKEELPGLRRRLDETAADPTALYFRVQLMYDNMYYRKAAAAKNLTPRTLLLWLDRVTKKGITWVEGESETTLDKVWDFLIESRVAALPNPETTATADAYNEAFWFKGIVTSQMTRHQHILGYSLFQLQIRAQLEGTTSPAETHGVWPWLTNQQIVDMVKQYDTETNASPSTASADDAYMADANGEMKDKSGGPNVAIGYELAGLTQDVKETSISDDLSKVKGALMSSEGYRAAMELLRAGVPVDMIENLSADNLEQLKLTYNSMLSERDLQVQQGKVQTRGLWPWISWDDLINMANPKTTTTTRASKMVNAIDEVVKDEGLQLPRDLGFSVMDALAQDTRFRESPESRFGRIRAESLEHKMLAKRVSAPQFARSQPTLPPITALPAEINKKIMEANERLFAAQWERALPPQPSPPESVADILDKNTDTSAFASFDNLAGPRSSGEERAKMVDEDASAVAGGSGDDTPKVAGTEAVDLSQVLAQLHILDSMLS